MLQVYFQFHKRLIYIFLLDSRNPSKLYSITVLSILQFDSKEEGDAETREEGGGDEPNPKRRHVPNLLLYIFILLPSFSFFFCFFVIFEFFFFTLDCRMTDAGTSEVPLSHKTVTEPKIIVQTRSEVDLLDDGCTFM